MHVKSPLYKKYKEEKIGWAILAIRTFWMRLKLEGNTMTVCGLMAP